MSLCLFEDFWPLKVWTATSLATCCDVGTCSRGSACQRSSDVEQLRWKWERGHVRLRNMQQNLKNRSTSTLSPITLKLLFFISLPIKLSLSLLLCVFMSSGQHTRPLLSLFLFLFYFCCGCFVLWIFSPPPPLSLSVRTGLEAIMETYAFWRPPVRTLTFEDFTNMQKQQGATEIPLQSYSSTSYSHFPYCLCRHWFQTNNKGQTYFQFPQSENRSLCLHFNGLLIILLF